MIHFQTSHNINIWNLMATFNIVLDKRTKLKKDKYNLAIRMVNVSDVMYINVSKMTQKQYDCLYPKGKG